MCVSSPFAVFNEIGTTAAVSDAPAAIVAPREALHPETTLLATGRTYPPAATIATQASTLVPGQALGPLATRAKIGAGYTPSRDAVDQDYPFFTPSPTYASEARESADSTGDRSKILVIFVVLAVVGVVVCSWAFVKCGQDSTPQNPAQGATGPGTPNQARISMPRPSIVWWDTTRCAADPDCTEFMEGKSVQNCIPHALWDRIDSDQRERVGKIGPEAEREEREQRKRAAEATLRAVAARRAAAENRAAEAKVAESTKPCPNCAAPTEKNDGCKHMTCRCKHECCWVCLRDWVPGHNSVRCAPAM